MGSTAVDYVLRVQQYAYDAFPFFPLLFFSTFSSLEFIWVSACRPARLFVVGILVQRQRPFVDQSLRAACFSIVSEDTLFAYIQQMCLYVLYFTAVPLLLYVRCSLFLFLGSLLVRRAERPDVC